MKIVFMGTPEYAVKILAALAGKHEILAVFTQPDKPAGRKNILTPPAVKSYALSNLNSVPIFQPSTLKGGAAAREIAVLKPDFIVVAAYGQILPKEILDIAPCINLHASVLPKYRGASPIQEAILAGEDYTGVTAMQMGEGLDDGDMLAFCVSNLKGKAAPEVFDELGDMAAALALKTLANYDKIAPVAQIHAAATKCKKIKKEHGLVKFEMSAEQIERKFLAYKDWPSVHLESGTKLLELEVSNLNGEPGEILEAGGALVVACGDKAIAIKTLQDPGKKPLAAREYINGKRLKVGDKFC